MDPNKIRAYFAGNHFTFIKNIAIVLTILFILITAYKWYGYQNDVEYMKRLNNCEKTAGSHGEYDDCIIFPTKDHQAKKASATLYTWITILIPIFLFGSYYSYAFFFLRKRPDV